MAGARPLPRPSLTQAGVTPPASRANAGLPVRRAAAGAPSRPGSGVLVPRGGVAAGPPKAASRFGGGAWIQEWERVSCSRPQCLPSPESGRLGQEPSPTQALYSRPLQRLDGHPLQAAAWTVLCHRPAPACLRSGGPGGLVQSGLRQLLTPPWRGPAAVGQGPAGLGDVREPAPASQSRGSELLGSCGQLWAAGGLEWQETVALSPAGGL